jgi:choline dehydrogenase-like flavoprotein
VLVVGSGQSGCQIAEELHEAGREVFLACGRAGWAPRRIGDHEVFWWLLEAGDLDDRVDCLPNPAARLSANVQASGHDGGHDLHYRTLRRMGVTLLGHFLGVDDRHARFAPDLAESVAWGDQRYAKVMGGFRKLAAKRRLPWPDVPEPEPFEAEAPERLGSGPTTNPGCTARGPSTSSAFRSTRTARAPWFPASTSSVCTSCESASRRS